MKITLIPGAVLLLVTTKLLAMDLPEAERAWFSFRGVNIYFEIDDIGNKTWFTAGRRKFSLTSEQERLLAPVLDAKDPPRSNRHSGSPNLED